MAGDISVRLYRAADTERLIDVFRQAVRRGAAADYTTAQRSAWAPDDIDCDAWAARCGARPTWVAECDGDIAGFTDLEPDGHIDMLFVHPDFHRKGIATTLLAHAESTARNQAIAGLYAEVSLTARSVFEKTGFAVIERRIASLRGERLANFRMQKLL